MSPIWAYLVNPEEVILYKKIITIIIKPNLFLSTQNNIDPILTGQTH